MRIEITKEVNLNKFHDELLEANLVNPTDYFGGEFFIAKDDADVNLIQHIIDSHDPTPLPKPLSEIEQLRIEQSQANAELFEMMLMLTGGMT